MQYPAIILTLQLSLSMSQCLPGAKDLSENQVIVEGVLLWLPAKIVKMMLQIYPLSAFERHSATLVSDELLISDDARKRMEKI